MAPRTTLANLIILSFFLISTASSLPIQQLKKREEIEKSYFDCFQSLIPSTLFLHPRGTPEYTKYFRANIQNLRFLNTTASYRVPSFILTPGISADVQSAVHCTRNISIGIRVRSGGHDYEGLSYVSPASTPDDIPYVLIDLAYIADSADFQIDLAQGTAWVGAGATIGQLYYHIAEKGDTIAFPSGICPTIGIGGLFSGGGIGALMRKYGLSADNIEDVTMVGPDGSLLDRASMSEDHFWAIRGGGGSSFGIIIRYKIRLVAVPRTVTTFAVTKTLADGAARLVERWQHVAPRLDDDAFIRIIALAADDKKAKGKRTVGATFQCLFLGGATELLKLMGENFPELGVKAEDCRETSWIGSVVDFAGFGNASSEVLTSREAQGKGSFKAKSDFVKEAITAEGWEKIFGFMAEAADEPVAMIMDPWGGRLDEIEEGEIAFPHRRGNLYNIQYFMKWFENDERVAQRHLGWMRRLYDLMAPYVSKSPRAAYLNYKDMDLGWNERGVSTNYSEARVWGEKYFLNNFQRLAYVKGKVDPHNKLWNELSIPPLF